MGTLVLKRPTTVLNLRVVPVMGKIYFVSKTQFLFIELMKPLLVCIFCLGATLTQQGCTTTGDIYTGEPGQEFDVENTAAAAIAVGIGAILINEATQGGGYYPSSSGSSSSCSGPYCSQTVAWDYLPGNGQWRCRDTGGYAGGQFVEDWYCANQYQVDNWQ